MIFLELFRFWPLILLFLEDTPLGSSFPRIVFGYFFQLPKSWFFDYLGICMCFSFNSKILRRINYLIFFESSLCSDEGNLICDKFFKKCFTIQEGLIKK